MLPLSQGLIRMNSGAICAQPGSTTSAQGSVLAAGICGSNPNTTGGWMKWNNLPIFPWVMFGRKQIFYLQLHIWWPRRNAGGVWLVLLDSCCTWRTVIIICCLFLNLRIPQEWQNTMTEFYKELQEQACYCGFHYGSIHAASTTGNHQSTIVPTPWCFVWGSWWQVPDGRAHVPSEGMPCTQTSQAWGLGYQAAQTPRKNISKVFDGL